MDYGAAAAKYVDAFMQNINWEEVNRRAEALERLNMMSIERLKLSGISLSYRSP